MATRPRPHIEIGNITKRRDREFFRDFVLEVIEDTFIYEFTPTSISLSGELFTLNLDGYKFVYEDLVVDDAIDYVDVYLYGVKQPKDRFQVTFNENSIIITFTESITRVPADVVTDFNNSATPSPFEIKGKIVEIE
jgi:hypothetical protein